MKLSFDYYRVLKGMKTLARQLEQHFCPHTESYDSHDWGWSYRKCRQCYKVLEKLR